MEKIKWAIMGAGKIAHAFANALASEENSVSYAVASRSEEKAAAFAEKYGFEKHYGSYEAMVNDPDVDIVYVATPMSCHYENVKLCFEHGKNVLCEKSITMDSTEARELVSIAREKNLFFMEAMWTKCLPAFLQAKKWIADGKIGTTEYIKADFCNSLKIDMTDRLFRYDLGGGALLDLGVYPITFALAFLGNKPDKVISYARFGRDNVDYDGTVILKYPNAVASLDMGFEMQSQNRADIIGSKGRIAFGDCFFMTQTVKLYDENGVLAEEKNFPHICNGYEYEITEANHALRAGEKESRLNPIEDTLAVMEIMDECRRLWADGCKA